MSQNTFTETETGPDEEPTTDSIIEVRDLRVSFEMDRGESRVLDDVSMDIQRGETLGIVGESGSGKSMFADSLLDAVVEPGRTTGSVTYHPEDGEPVDLLELDDEGLRRVRWEEIAMVFQGAQSAFNPTLKLDEHFRETLAAHDADVAAGMERANELLEDLYLQPERVLDSYAHELSGGMKQRALIALSLLLDPEVLVLDEPTAALDLLMQRSIIQLLDEIQRKYDLTMVFITHDLPLVADLADRVAVLYSFEFVETGPTETVLSDAHHPYTRALLNATPNLSAPLEEMRPIEGSAPDPVDVPSGCSYRDRCPLADEQCRRVDPTLEGTTADRAVACFHWEAAREEVPLLTEATDE